MTYVLILSLALIMPGGKKPSFICFYYFQPAVNKTKCLPQSVVNVDPSPSFILVTMLFSAAGLVCTLLTLIVFVTLKDHPVIKASSRGLSCLLLVGIMVSYGENFLDLIAPGNSCIHCKRAEKSKQHGNKEILLSAHDLSIRFRLSL